MNGVEHTMPGALNDLKILMNGNCGVLLRNIPKISIYPFRCEMGWRVYHLNLNEFDIYLNERETKGNCVLAMEDERRIFTETM